MKNSKAIFYASLAAFFNAFVGIFSVLLYKANFTSFEVAFFKCFLAGLILFLFVCLLAKLKNLFFFIKKKFKALFLCAFCGFFMLYHFESAAYVGMSVASVVFVLFASSLFCTFFCESLVRKRFFNFKEITSLALAFLGLYLIFLSEANFKDLNNAKALINAILAGVGYGLFLFFTKKFELKTGIIQLCALLLIGSFYLAFPFIVNSNYAYDFSLENLLLLLALAFLPTIGGFYCTIKALSFSNSNSVALIELSEPIFAMILAFFLLAQSPNFLQGLGGSCILAAIILHELIFLSPKA